MTTPLRRRLIAFCTVIAALVFLAGWSAFTSWRELGTLRRRFTSAQFESFRIAGQLQSNVLDLNSALLAYEVSSEGADWERFQKGSDKLNAWIDLQRAALKTAGEKRFLADIDAEYDRYLAVAQAIRGEHSERTAPAISRVHQLDAAAQRMFALAGRLADAHRAALGDLLGESQRSVQRLEALFGAGFVLVLAVGAWGTRVLFRETITPLRRQLIEVQALAEQREKLASLGVLAAGVAHEIRNPLTAIKLQTYMLRQSFEKGAPAREAVAVIDNEIDRLERIVSDFLRFARPSDPEFVMVTSRDLFQETCALLAPELAEKAIELCVESGADDEPFRADPRQLKQVLINLIRNAAESIEDRGRVTLRASHRSLPLDGKQRAVIVLEVEDTGAGIPADVQERLFDPFFTTKEAGTGLGLSIAMRILESHGGTLQFQTAPGCGTTFGMVLPLLSSGSLAPNDSEHSARALHAARDVAVNVPASLRAVAIFEAAKGALVLLGGCGLLRFAHVYAQHSADELVRHFHLNPATSHPRIFERLLLHISDTQMRLLALGALAYAAFRFVEAWGLWRGRRWAGWLALASGAAYLPVELYEFIHTRHWAPAVVFAVNALIVAVLALRLRRCLPHPTGWFAAFQGHVAAYRS